MDVLSEIEMEDVNDLEINIGGAALYVRESEDDTFGFMTEGRENISVMNPAEYYM